MTTQLWNLRDSKDRTHFLLDRDRGDIQKSTVSMRPLTFSEVGVDTHIASGTSETFVVFEGDVFAGVCVDVLLGQAEVYHVDYAMSVVGLSAN